MLVLISILSYANKFWVKKDVRVFNLFKFEFQKGGIFKVNVFNCHAEDLLFIISTQDKINRFMKEQNMQQPCNATQDFAYHIKINNSFGTISGKVEKEGVYISKVLSCKYFIDPYELQVSFQNLNSCLSFNYVKFLQIYPIILFISGFLLFIWFLNWLMFNCSPQNKNHNILTLSLFLFFCKKMFYYLNLMQKSKSDDLTNGSILECIYLIFPFLYCFCISRFILSIISEENRNYVYFFIISYFFIWDSTLSFAKNPLVIVIILVFMVLMSYEYIISMLNEQENDNEIRYFKRKNHLFLVYSLFHIIISEVLLAFDWFFYFPFFFLLAVECSNDAIMICIVFIYRLKNNTLANYDILDRELTPNFI